MEIVNSHITIMIIIFQTRFLENTGNTTSVRNIVSSIELMKIHTLFKLVEIECAKSINLESEIVL